jgi:6-phosphofructokinase 1
MTSGDLNFEISRLGEGRIPSPLKGVYFVKDDERVLFHSGLSETKEYFESGKLAPSFEKAGPREKIYFDPSKLKCGIVTCGGLCPGLNSVIRAIVLSLHHSYGVRTIYGFPYGYEGLSYRYGHKPVELNPVIVDRIHEQGGTILGSSRGNQDGGHIGADEYRNPFHHRRRWDPARRECHFRGDQTQRIKDRRDRYPENN